MAISFPFDSRKAVEMICWLVNQEPGIDLYTVVKAIYYAEKQHLLSYGRPIVGDVYSAMDHGMVPSKIYDALKQDARGDLHELVGTAVGMKVEDYPRYYAKRSPDENLLSESDVACLRDALEKCSGLSFPELRALAHAEKAWREAWSRRSDKRSIVMKYEEMIDKDLPGREQLIRQLTESSSTLVL